MSTTQTLPPRASAFVDRFHEITERSKLPVTLTPPTDEQPDYFVLEVAPVRVHVESPTTEALIRLRTLAAQLDELADALQEGGVA